MKAIIIIFLIFVLTFFAIAKCSAQDVMNTNYIYKAEFKYKISAKTVKYRFKKANINKQIHGHYYISIKPTDKLKNFTMLGIKFYCLPKKIRKEL